MKIYSWPSFGIAALLTLGFSPTSRANLFSDNFEMLVVAETAIDAPAHQNGPITYAAIDGGYIEAGDPIVGDTPPTPGRVRQALFDAMKDQGFVANRTGPSVLLTYHWGVLRVDHRQARPPFGVNSNIDARIKLVSTEEMGAEVENHIYGRQKANGTNMNVSSPPILVGALETVSQNSRQARIFVIVSAYDYQGLTQRHEAKPLWRVKMSAMERSGDMNEVIPSLIAKGAPYFGKNLTEGHIVQAVLTNSRDSGQDSNLQPAPDSNLNSQVIEPLLKSEGRQFSGEDPAFAN
jgi:hypothetical protein